MSKHSGRNLAFVLLLALSTASVGRAFASTAGQAPGQSTASTGSVSEGITGTDPEPIDPDIVYIILTILNLA